VIREIVLWPAREAGRRAERLTLATLDAVLASRVGAEAVDRVLDSELAKRAIARAVERVADEMGEGPALDSPAMDRLVARLLESRELWLVVEEIAQSPAVTDAITRQSIGFADQVAGQVRDHSRSADARLERAARRALRRPPAGPEAP
jgi:6-phosphogluconate dehydrogenase (decarboxylating)